MARTIHDTLGVADEAERSDWSNADIPEAIAREMRRNWMRQQDLREGQRRIRQRGGLAPQPVDPEQLPVLRDRPRAGIHQAIDEDDIRAVLRRLPPGSLDGLHHIQLCRGQPGHELAPGVILPSPLGRYDPNTAVIQLFAFFCDDPGPLSLLLIVQSLTTLVHEVAHHFDWTFRKGRHRWHLNDKDKHEAWARRVEDDLAWQIVLPVVEERHPALRAALATWIAERTGARIDVLPLMHKGVTAFAGLVRASLAGQDGDASRVAFARGLHRAGENQSSLAIVDAILARRPDDSGALAVRACIAHCADRDHPAAEAFARRAVTVDPACADGWEVLARGYAIQGRWEDVALACAELIAREPRPRWYVVETLTEAHLHLCDWAAVDADVARMRARGGELAARYGDVYEVLARCWGERWEDALLLATRLLAAGKHDDWELWLAAARYESALRLGRPDQGGRFDAPRLRMLADFPFTAEWAQRIQRAARPAR